MAKKLSSDVAELLNRAEADTKNVPLKTPKPKAVEQRLTEPAAGRVYNGDPQSQTPGYVVPPRNKKVAGKKRRSTFNIITVLFLSAIIIVFYIGNILAVNQLAVEVHQLQMQYEQLQNNNGVLKAEINRKSGWERIGAAAKEQAGLTYPKEHPQSFDVDANKLDQIKDK